MAPKTLSVSDVRTACEREYPGLCDKVINHYFGARSLVNLAAAGYIDSENLEWFIACARFLAYSQTENVDSMIAERDAKRKMKA